MSAPERGTDNTLEGQRETHFFQAEDKEGVVNEALFELYLKGCSRSVNEMEWQGHSIN
jgi:hypothetical protein